MRLLSTLVLAALLAGCGFGTDEPDPGPLPRVVWDGNSLVAGAGLSNKARMPGQAARLLGGGWDAATVFAVSGQNTSAMLADAAAQVDPLYSAANPHPQIVVAWEGTNEALYSSAATGYEELAEYCRGRRAAGFRVILGTLLPRSDAPTTPPEHEGRRQEINRLLRLHWPQFADGLFDPAADRRLGVLGAQRDPAYYQSDKVHLNATGAGIVARLVVAEVRRVAQI